MLQITVCCSQVYRCVHSKHTKGVHSLVTQTRLGFKSWWDYSGVSDIVCHSVVNVCKHVLAFILIDQLLMCVLILLVCMG